MESVTDCTVCTESLHQTATTLRLPAVCAPVIFTGTVVAEGVTAYATCTNEICAVAVTVNVAPLLAVPPTPTTTLPVVAPVGTGTTMLVADQLVGVAAVPLNVTVLEPRVDPKFEPLMVTTAPTGPLAGDRFVIDGAVLVTVNVCALLATPPTATTTLPVVAPVGTGTTMLVADQLVRVGTR